MSLNSKQLKNILEKEEELVSCEEDGEDGPYFGIEYLDDEKKNEDESIEILYIQYSDESDNSPSTAENNIVSNLSKSHESKRVVNVNTEVLKGSCKDSLTYFCRLCLKTVSDYKNIFKDNLENDISIFVGIMSCIHPLKIFKGDRLSDRICNDCFFAIKMYFGFRKICLQNDKEQRKKLKSEVNLKIQLPSSKRKKRRITESECESDSIFEDLHETDDEYEEDLIKFFESERIDIEEDKLVKIDNLDAEDEVEISKGDKINAQIRKIIQGSLTEEQAQAENIIIHVQNDDEENETLTALTKLKLPIVIKPVKSKERKQKSKNVLIDYDDKISILEDNHSEKEISDVGVFKATTINYVFGFEFCLIDGYIFEYRLCKGKVRYLRCLLPTCYAKGVQDKIKEDFYSNLVTIEKSHNHPRPDDNSRKKQMFFFVMKRKLHSDKGLNIKDVYEEINAQDSEIQTLIPLKNVISEICKHQVNYKLPDIHSFQQFYNLIEENNFQKLQFTQNGKQFYQEKFIYDQHIQAVVFGNKQIIDQVSDSELMYVDASFIIDSNEDFKYHLMTVLIWIDNSYYPIYYGLVNVKCREIYKMVLQYLHDILAPKLRPKEIITDFEANLYYALGEIYVNSTIAGSVFYYTQNLYKKICSLNLSRDLETNGNFRNLYYMLLMLPLLPVNTILAGLNNIQTQAKDLGLSSLMTPLFDHVRNEWIIKVTPNFFCVHNMENRINENVTAPFKKLRDYLMLAKGKATNKAVTIVTVVEKLIELEYFLQITYSAPSKKSFARDLSSTQKRNVLKAWQFIESHPKININNFFGRVVGYIRCMENQLWIWGFYRYSGDINDELINAANFSIVTTEDDDVFTESMECEEAAYRSESELVSENENSEEYAQHAGGDESIVIDAIVGENGIVQTNKSPKMSGFNKSFLKYVQEKHV